MMPSPVVRIVLEQHVEELTTLWAVRDGLCAAAHIQLRDLARFDERIAAHEDGCALAGDDGLRVLTAQLAEITPGGVFGLALVGFALNDHATIARCVALAEANPDARRGLTSALGWVEPVRLKGIAKSLLDGSSAVQRCLGLAACRLHGVDPGNLLRAALTEADNDVRAEAARTAGTLGLADVASLLGPRVDEDANCRFWSAWSAVSLGNRTRALDTLMNVAFSAGQHRRRAFPLACQVMGVTAAHEILCQLAQDPAEIRWVIEGSGIVGDSVYVPWLINHMADPATARLAAEAFSLITGVDFGQGGLEGKRPEGFESGPTDDPADPNVAEDPDDSLPWPNVIKTEKWWGASRGRFPKGVRYFMGAPVTRAHCIDVLKTGYQRQRILAAHYLCLLEPGTPLFNTSAPAWRQQRLLARM